MTLAPGSGPAVLAALTRRRFLLVAAAAAGATGLAGCSDGSGDTGAAGTSAGELTSSTPRSSAASGPSGSDPASSSVGSSAAPPASAAGAVPQALRGTGERRGPGDPAAARAALTGFGVDFLHEAIAGAAGPNVAISPYSLYTVLAMARAGAKGTTAAQIDKALRAKGIEAQGAVISAVDAGIASAVQASQNGDEDPIILQAANQTWVQRDYDVHQEYLDALAVQYGVQAMAADFATDPETMRTAINDWVAQRTNELIPELFPDGSINDLTRLVLVNAVYFKGGWVAPFTLDGDLEFSTTGGPVTTPGMVAPDPVAGARGKNWTAVSIPYRGSAATMTIVVPQDIAAIDVEVINTVTTALAADDSLRLRLSMPLFSIRSDVPAGDIAETLGITDIFDSATADLSRMAGVPGDLFAQSFVHQAVVVVDENGTEAAAATGMAAGLESMPQDDGELVVDRPFLFWISETTTGAPLFLGVVTDPTD